MPDVIETESQMIYSIAGKKLTFVSGQASVSQTLISAITGKKIRVKSVMLNNAGGSDISVNLTITIGGSIVSKFKLLLKAGAIFSKKMSPDYIEGDVSTAVGLFLSASGAVNYDVDYEVVS